MRGDIAERDCPAVALAAAGSSPVGLASGSEAPPTSRGLRAPRDYPRYGFNDVKLGSVCEAGGDVLNDGVGGGAAPRIGQPVE